MQGEKHIKTYIKYLLFFSFCIALPLTGQAQSSTSSAVEQWRQSHEREIIEEYLELLSIPNVSRNGEDISANVVKITALFQGLGFDVSTSAESNPRDETAPVIIATRQAENAAGTLLVYIHYDGVPVTPALWSTCPPFQPCIANDGEVIELTDNIQSFDPQWRIHGRSASDDKAPIMSMAQAVKALNATGQTPAWNIVLLLDGQEESGSANFRRYLAEQGDSLQADLAITLDGPRHPSTRPTMYYGVRGGASLLVKVHTAQQPLHSGNYGNWAPDPSVSLGRLLASMKDERGRITIDGFYDQVTPLTFAELQALDSIPDIEDELLGEFGIAEPEQADTRLEAKLNLPTLNILAMDSGGGLGAPGITAIPAFAQARIAMRLVQGIDPAQQQQKVIAHIRAQGFHVVENREPTASERLQYPRLVSVSYSGGRAAVRVPLGHPLTNAVANAISLDGIRPAQLPTLGGGLPFGDFAEGLDMPTVGVALVNHDNNQHGPDENLKIQNLWEGIEILSRILTMPAQ